MAKCACRVCSSQHTCKISYSNAVDVQGVINTLVQTTTSGTLSYTAFSLSRKLSRTSWATSPPDVEEYWTPETITGWRGWRLAGYGSTVLVGMNGVMWRKPTMHAIHQMSNYDVTPPHQAPAWGCNCGINAVKRLDTLSVSRSGSGPGSVYGVLYGKVAMSGIVHEYELGYRAEKATISELFFIAEGQCEGIAEGIVETLRKHYRVPVRLTVSSSPLSVLRDHANEIGATDGHG